MERIKKIIVLIFIQLLLFMNFSWAAGGSLLLNEQEDVLSPQIQINNLALQEFVSFIPYLQKQPPESVSNIKLKVEQDLDDTRFLSIEDVSDGFKTNIRLLEKNYPNYSPWVSSQYGTMALADYPHLSTKLMINGMLSSKEIFKDAVVLEAGCGDGMLSVLSSRLGARHVYAVEKQKGILEIAKKTVNLNKSRGITFFEGNFIGGNFDFDYQPTVLMLNIGGYVAEHLIDTLEKYPTIEHVVLVSENIHVYGGKERLIDLLVKIKQLGEIESSSYLEKEVYYTNVFNEGCWGFVVDIKKDKADVPAVNEKQDKVIENPIGRLKELGFNYADKFAADFNVPIKDEYGDAQLLVVTEDGENAFIIREQFEFGYGQGNTQRIINLVEINPFTPNTGFFHKGGFCRYRIHESKKEATLGIDEAVIIKTSTHRNSGLASAMLSLAVEKVQSLGMETITAHNVEWRATTLYEKLGFGPKDRKAMSLDLENDPQLKPDGTGSWRLQDVANYRGFRFRDLRQHELPKKAISVKELKDKVLYNRLIQEFFTLDSDRIKMGIPWSFTLHQIIELKDEFINDVIKQAEAKGEDWISKQAEIIRETHSSRSSYEDTETGGSWTSFISKVDKYSYNLPHLLGHTIGFVQNYLDIGNKEKAQEFFEQGYIILRAIEIESRNKNDDNAIALDTLTKNKLIESFFDRSKTFAREEDSLAYNVKILLSAEDAKVMGIIRAVEYKGEAWIEQEGLTILKEFFDKPVYEQFKKVNNWTDFIAIETKGKYDLQQLLVHTIGTADFNYQMLKRLKPKSEHYKPAEKLFADNFRSGYIVLRAVDIEARKNEEKNKKDKEFLPDVEVHNLGEHKALLMADKLGTVFENKNINFLDDATDVNPMYAYSLKTVGNIEIKLLGQDPDVIYTMLGVSLKPDTYYVAVVDGDNIIGYGALDYGIMPGDENIVIAFRIFKEYRHQKEAVSARIFKSLLSAAREIFGKEVRKFILPYHQINEKEGIDSSAVIFYLKMGFELADSGLQSLWRTKYLKQVLSGQSLSKDVIEKISQSTLILDLDDIENAYNAKRLSLPESSLELKSIDNFQVLIYQAI